MHPLDLSRMSDAQLIANNGHIKGKLSYRQLVKSQGNLSIYDLRNQVYKPKSNVPTRSPAE